LLSSKTQRHHNTDQSAHHLAEAWHTVPTTAPRDTTLRKSADPEAPQYRPQYRPECTPRDTRALTVPSCGRVAQTHHSAARRRVEPRNTTNLVFCASTYSKRSAIRIAGGGYVVQIRIAVDRGAPKLNRLTHDLRRTARTPPFLDWSPSRRHGVFESSWRSGFQIAQQTPGSALREDL
jgi:hypothetical protein